jgi:type II secretory ATPase GspE/PulE/Tfp pilus assembly ATPase PilB-like protein/transcriptional regulator with GAF, ATPase, and Fis domain
MNFFSNELSSQKPIEEIVGEIHELVRSAENIKDHIPQLVEQLKLYFDCEAITIFAVDQPNRQLYSTCYISDEVPEMRVDISLNNLAGYVAGTGNSLNIANVKDKAELAQYHPHLDHGSKWDNLLDFSSKSMIVVPIPFKQNLIGILEVINKKNDEAFSSQDLKYVQDIAPALGLVLVRYYNDGLQSKHPKQEATSDANDLDTGDHDKSLENQHTKDEVAENDEQIDSSLESHYTQDEIVEETEQVDESLENQYTHDNDTDSSNPNDSALKEDELHNTDKEDEIRKISQAILEGKNLKEILTELKDSILDNFEAEGMTLYGLDSTKNEIYSTFQSRELSNEIRLPLANSNIPGYVAKAKRPVNIVNVDNQGELKAYHNELVFDDFENDTSGNKTSELLALPVMHEEVLLGVLKIVNKKNKTPFTEKDEARASIIAKNLAHALSKQEQTPKTKPTKFSYLIENDLITEKILDSSTAYAKSNNVDIETVLMDRVGLKRKSIGLSLENFYNLPYYGYEKSIILPAKILGGLNKNFLAKNYWIPIYSDNSKVTILTNDPNNLDRIQNIKHIFPKKEMEFKVGLKVDLMDFLNSILEQDGSFIEPVKSEKMSSLINTLQEENDDTQLLTDADDDPGNTGEINETDNAIIRLVNKVLTDAYDRGATDIHIEPGIAKDNITIRFRKDGDCSIYEEIPFLYKHAIISRIKIMAQLDIAERRIPQDGKIKMRYGEATIEYRVATCPTVGENEDIVLRILAKSENLPLEKMNFTERNLEKIMKNVTTPYGLILVVGPTGSGKTTTLHSCLGHINTPKKKIWTVEDPVEITQKGIRQVQTIEKKGLDFPRAMRSFLRGDPDVIMVGEMRDKETASIGLEASLTGHLVFSTLHTNSAPETITRLLDMGMNPLNFADSILLVVAQRLVKTLCKNCREDYHPTQEQFDTIVQEYGEESFEKLGIVYDGDLTLKKPVGCESCDNTGYAGRTGLHEVLEGTKALKRQIVKQASAEELRATAINEGMCTLKQDGIQKIFKGDCDLKQVLAVCII